jgi:hypothetical protein
VIFDTDQPPIVDFGIVPIPVTDESGDRPFAAMVLDFNAAARIAGSTFFELTSLS